MKKGFLFFILVCLLLAVPFTCLGEVKKIDPSKLEGKTLEELYMMRMETYARHGRPFKTYELNNYFRSQNWYQIAINDNGESTYSDNILSEVEKQNIETITMKEKELLKQNYLTVNGEKRINVNNIINTWQFAPFSSEDLEMFSKNGFLVYPAAYPPSKEDMNEYNPIPYEQFFWLYEENNYRGVANFITSDAILQLYHIFFDFTLRNMESEKLFPVVKDLTSVMLSLSRKLSQSTTDKTIKEAALRNLAYFAVPNFFLTGVSSTYPEKINAIIQAEIQKSVGHVGRDNSLIFNPDSNPFPPHDLDYSQYIIRGHYTRSDTLKKYFMALMWYGQNYFLTDQQLDFIQSLIITKQLYDTDYRGKKLIDLWETIYEPTVFYVGLSDDLGPQDFKTIIDTVYGTNPSFQSFNDPDKLTAAKKIADEIYSKKKKIRNELYLIPNTAQFRFMGQRYIPDSEILQRLTKWTDTIPRIPLRPFPKGLDVMAVLGSQLATQIVLDEHLKEGNVWKEYPVALLQLTQEFSLLTPQDWTHNLYVNWLYCLKSLIELAKDKTYPFFMQNTAWEKKSLVTSLASWSELRHDTILYGSPSGAEKGAGGDWEPDPPKGLVEPNPEFFRRMKELLSFSHDGLQKRKLLTDQMKEKFQKFIEMVNFLEKIATKELNQEQITNPEYDQIALFGTLLENLTISVMTDGTEILNWFEIQSDTDKSVAVIADIHTARIEVEKDGDKQEEDLVLEVGVGPVYEIYVVSEIGGYLRLTRGAVFSYFEFQHPLGDRLTDEAWQTMLKERKNPPMFSWTNEFLSKNIAPDIPKLQYVYDAWY